MHTYTCNYNYISHTCIIWNGNQIWIIRCKLIRVVRNVNQIGCFTWNSNWDVNQSHTECELILAKNCFTSGESLSKQVSRKVYSRKLNKPLHPLG